MLAVEPTQPLWLWDRGADISIVKEAFQRAGSRANLNEYQGGTTESEAAAVGWLLK
jgi:hypothetical protein